ncbi:MAG: hypothetical protein ACOYMG_09695 [Candidatus Methylumidiphilus sp.]
MELLGHPFAVGQAQEALLKGLGEITRQNFKGDIWQFVGWTQTEQGRGLVHDLK